MTSFLVKKAIAYPCSFRKITSVFTASVRNVVSNYQYKPGPYPKTDAERVAAAKKYGIPIDEYMPYPEEMGYGDYPKLPDIGADSKDVFYPWDCPEMKRNFNEPVHATVEMYGEDRYNPSMKDRYPLSVQWAAFLGGVGSCLALFFYLEDFKLGRPVIAKQYPGEGPHYYFSAK